MLGLSRINTPGYCYPERQLTLPEAQIPNPNILEPVFAWRGILLDSARTMWAVETILELLELMARYRFNRLHWHLTDNCGWRLPVPGYPRLVEISAQLPRMAFDEYGNVDPQKLAQYQNRARFLNNSGFYSYDNIAEIVEKATELGIEIVPEIDLPGHMEAVILAYPDLGNPLFHTLPKEINGKVLRNNLLWPNEQSFEFIEASLTKVAELFPSSIVHIGGDECDFEFWEQNPEGQQWMMENDITSGKEIQGLFMQKARKILAYHGKKVGVWDEAVATNLFGDEIVFAWQEEKGVPNALASAHPWVFCDANYLYLNRLAGAANTEPIGMYGVITPEIILEMQIPKSEKLLGIQASAWCEFIPGREELYYQLFPRLLAAAERAWCGNQVDPKEAIQRVNAEYQILKQSGLM